MHKGLRKRATPISPPRRARYNKRRPRAGYGNRPAVNTLLAALRAARIKGPSAVAVGVFDGVHLGHRHVLRALRDDARDRALRSVALTFANHPLTILRPHVRVVLLTQPAERVELLRACGIDAVAPLAFTRELSEWSAERFVAALAGEAGMRHMVIGPDFALGRGREGGADRLAMLGERYGYTLRVVEPLRSGGRQASSSAVRQALAVGDVEGAAAVLGRPFGFAAPIVEGEGRGASLLGYPTCNFGVSPAQAVPADGVYAGSVEVDGRRWGAAVSVGAKPTFHEDGPRVVEAFLLGFEGDLYGRHARLEFAARLRGQERFETADALIAQIDRDVEATRRILAQAPAPAQEETVA